MVIDGEPEDGDYVRYIEKLTNRGLAAPGQVVGKARELQAAPVPPPSPGEVVRDAPPVTRKPGKAWGRGAAPGAPASPAPQNGTRAADATLAGQATRRRGALAVTIVALAIAWQAVRMLFDAWRQPGFNPRDLMPVAFLLLFAGMLWRAARSQRTRAKQPLTPLPPLTTISKHGPGKSGR